MVWPCGESEKNMENAILQGKVEVDGSRGRTTRQQLYDEKNGKD